MGNNFNWENPESSLNPFQPRTGIFSSPLKPSASYRKYLTENYKPEPEKTTGKLSQTTLLDMLKSGLLNEEGLRKRLKEAGLGDVADPDLGGKTEIDKVIELAVSKGEKDKRDISTDLMARALQKGIMTPDQVKARLGENYDPEDAGFMFQLIQNSAKENTPGLNLSQMSNALKHGMMSQEDIAKRLKDLGYSDDDAGTLMGLIQSDTKNKTLSMSALSDAFKRGDLKEADVLKRLTDVDQYDLSAEDAKIVMNEMKQTTKLGLGPLAELYSKDQLDPASVKDRLMKQHGYSSEDADLMLQTFQNDKNKAAEVAREKAERDAKEAANEAKQLERERKQAQRERNNEVEQTARENARAPQTFSDQVNGYLENFHRDFLTQLRDAKLGPAATNWLMNNQDLVLNQHIGGGTRGGGVLSGASLMNIYESQRGMARKQGETGQQSIQAQQIG